MDRLMCPPSFLTSTSATGEFMYAREERQMYVYPVTSMEETHGGQLMNELRFSVVET